MQLATSWRYPCNSKVFIAQTFDHFVAKPALSASFILSLVFIVVDLIYSIDAFIVELPYRMIIGSFQCPCVTAYGKLQASLAPVEVWYR